MLAMAVCIGTPSKLSSSEKMPTTKALSHSSGGSASAARSSIRRPRTTAVVPTAGDTPLAAAEVVISKAAHLKSFFRPSSITACLNEVISVRSPNPAELMKRSRLNERVGSRLSTSSISAVLACLRTRLISWRMAACEGRRVCPSIMVGLANQ